MRIAGPRRRQQNELFARYHYLGYAPMSGQQLRYSVCAGDRRVALLGFAAASGKLADRERYDAWSDKQRRSRLHRVVNNTHFLILPWVQCRGLASKVLAMSARLLPTDWRQRYGFEPVLLETFVESSQHKETCYLAANWQCVGRTTGRGKTSTTHQAQLPVKDGSLYPLRQDFRRILTAQMRWDLRDHRIFSNSGARFTRDYLCRLAAAISVQLIYSAN